MPVNYEGSIIEVVGYQVTSKINHIVIN